ncbi:MAG: ABC transporter ATP-binding protein [Cyclobacteriaceae bacterium]|nr:ABC transporter ATP-binding protein [Cyclobacteriaceae bacterium]
MISAQELSVGFRIRGKEQMLFEKIDVHLPPGELVCFMGSNGVGKSTLLKTLAGLLPPLAGKVTGLDQNVALVLTDKITATNMTVYDLVSFGQYPYLDWRISLSAANEEAIEGAIRQVHLESLRDRKLNELSDGQLQLVMIAKALAQQTPVILLDEPTAHLDLNNRVEVMNLLRSLSRKLGKSILVTTHELDLALQTADLIWLATANKKIKKGIPEDLVLDGAFDEVFQFKGFDLKTGKIEHEAHRKKEVQLLGTGYSFLWTKNALERSGYGVVEKAKIQITVFGESKTLWKLNGSQFESLATLLAAISHE